MIKLFTHAEASREKWVEGGSEGLSFPSFRRNDKKSEEKSAGSGIAEGVNSEMALLHCVMAFIRIPPEVAVAEMERGMLPRLSSCAKLPLGQHSHTDMSATSVST